MVVRAIDRRRLTPRCRALAIVVNVSGAKPSGARSQVRRDDPRLAEALEVLDGVARGVARQIGGRYEIDDLKGHAHEAIADVVSKFDPSRGIAFRSYARLRLRGAIIDGLRRESGLPRGVAARLRALEAADLYVEAKGEEHGAARPTSSQASDARLSGFLRGLATAYATGLVAREPEPSAAPDADAVVDPESIAARREARTMLERALTDIGEPEGTILRRHYFMDEDLQDAAASVGLSKSWGSRLHARGIEKLAARLAELRESL